MGLPLTAHPPALRPKSIAAEISEVLQEEIIAGKFRPGQRLLERDLVRRFEVSAIPVREAFQELESRGLLLRRHNRGCSVIKLTATEAGRICELRRTLEPKVAEWACERITGPAKSQIREQLKRMEGAAAARDYPRFFQEDLTFHRFIWHAADNPYAARALEMILGSLFASGLIGAAQSAAIDLVAEVKKHRRLLTAICGGDPKRAALALLEIATGFERHVHGAGG
jgi:GntR family transcriptional regulator, rspAB operon transcriptional repressor